MVNKQSNIISVVIVRGIGANSTTDKPWQTMTNHDKPQKMGPQKWQPPLQHPVSPQPSNLDSITKVHWN